MDIRIIVKHHKLHRLLHRK